MMKRVGQYLTSLPVPISQSNLDYKNGLDLQQYGKELFGGGF